MTAPWRATRPVHLVTLDFLTNGGDGYPLNTLITDRRGLFTTGADPDLTVHGREQQAFADHIAAEHGTPDRAYAVAETPPALDERLQHLAYRADTVLDGAGGGASRLGSGQPTEINRGAVAARVFAYGHEAGSWAPFWRISFEPDRAARLAALLLSGKHQQPRSREVPC